MDAAWQPDVRAEVNETALGVFTEERAKAVRAVLSARGGGPSLRWT